MVNFIEFAQCIVELQRIKHFARFSRQFLGDIATDVNGKVERCYLQNFFKVLTVVSEMWEVKSLSTYGVL